MGGRALGVAGQVGAIGSDVADLVIKHKPEWLKENRRFQLMRPKEGNEFSLVPSGYTVERQGDRLIYRDSNGSEVSKDEAMAALEGHPSA